MWWQGLHAWANSTRGYLEVEQVGASPFVWLALMAVVGVLLVIDAIPDGSPRRSAVALIVFLLVAGTLALGNLAAALPDGVSLAGLTLGAFSTAQVALVTMALAFRQREGQANPER